MARLHKKILKILKAPILFSIGGAVYMLMELIWRGHSHIAMFVVGGIAFLCIGRINEYLPWDLSFWIQCLAGDAIILILEFVSGCILNLWLQLNIWDYSNLPLNILGQVCLPFAALWYFAAAFAIVADDYLRYWLFREERPRYNFKLTRATKRR